METSLPKVPLPFSVICRGFFFKHTHAPASLLSCFILICLYLAWLFLILSHLTICPLFIRADFIFVCSCFCNLVFFVMSLSSVLLHLVPLLSLECSGALLSQNWSLQGLLTPDKNIHCVCMGSVNGAIGVRLIANYCIGCWQHVERGWDNGWSRQQRGLSKACTWHTHTWGWKSTFPNQVCSST